MRSSNCPMVLRGYCIKRRAWIHNITPQGLFQNNSLNNYSATFGIPADISNLCNFGWYKWIYYQNSDQFPENKERLGHTLGPIKNEGNEMVQAILTASGKVLPCHTLQHLKPAELNNLSEQKKQDLFNEHIRKKLGNAAAFPTAP